MIAGAGSGKTTVMAARVVWLVGTGAVRPEEVLGLTFTNKAAAELAVAGAHGAGAAAVPARTPGRRGIRHPTSCRSTGSRRVATYHAYAGRLLRDHGLRIGVEPGARLLADATRFQLAERVLRRAPGPFDTLGQVRPRPRRRDRRARRRAGRAPRHDRPADGPRRGSRRRDRRRAEAGGRRAQGPGRRAPAGRAGAGRRPARVEEKALPRRPRLRRPARGGRTPRP